MIGTISAAGLFFLRNKFPSQNLFLILFLIVLFLIVYLILIIIFRALDKNDIDIIKSAYYYVGKIKRKVM